MEVKIGLEIHVQLNTKAKLFCSCPNPKGDEEPNTVICEVCTAQPGSKPSAVNEEAIKLGVLAAHMLKCRIEKNTYFMRKHYFYPDLPSGYQRTSKPIGRDGELLGYGIWEIHVEEDPGKYEIKKGLIDYNRSGTPLIEVVTAPDFKSADEVKRFLLAFEKGLSYYNIVKENGAVKADVNVSVNGGNRVEVKNVNSFENIVTAIEYEIKRQTRLVEEGKSVEQETRHFDEAKGITKAARKKESEADYRYMPDPDLLPIDLTTIKIDEKLLERPWEREERFQKEYGISKEAAEELTWEFREAELFERLSKKLNPKKVANWLRTAVKKQLNYRGLSFTTMPISDEHLESLAEMFFNNEISDDGMEQILIHLLDRGDDDPRKIAEKLDLFLMESSAIDEEVKAVIGEFQKAIEDYKNGEKKVIAFLVGQVMRRTRGKADPKKAKELLEKYIGE